MTDTHITAHIPDEAVQAAFEAMNPMKSPSECCLYDVKKGLEAALPYLSAPCAVEVRPSSLVNAASILASDAPHIVVQKLDAAYSQIVTKPVDALTAAEAVYGVVGWLTSRNETVVLGASHGAAIGAELADAFCKENNLGNCRDNYHEYLNHPSITISQPVDVAAVRRQAFEEAATCVDAKAEEYEGEKKDVRNSIDDKRLCGAIAVRLRGSASAIRALSAEPAQGDQSGRAALAQGGGE